MHAAVNATPLDWATMLNLDRDALFGEDPADRVIVLGSKIDAGDKLRAAGVIRVNIFDLVVGKVGFAFEQRVVDVDLDYDQTIGADDLNGATLTTLGLRILPDDNNVANGDEGNLHRRRRHRLPHRDRLPRTRDRQAAARRLAEPGRRPLLARLTQTSRAARSRGSTTWR